ncbi:MAG: type II secretion system protein [Phycisphaerae bacterium]|nr:type II secretion system protein [Phycisphaerae bacterium]
MRRSLPLSRRRSHCRNRRFRGFTLIELLVVIAIISLLVSILVPSLQKAKGLAKEVVCLNNQRTIYAGHMFYAEDHEDWQVTVFMYWDPPNNPYEVYRWNWWLTYNEYLPWGEGEYANRHSPVAFCPLDGEFDTGCQYARNQYGHLCTFRMEDIVNPTDKVLTGDSYDAPSLSTDYIAFGRGALWNWEDDVKGYSPHGRHENGRGLFSFMDGHGGSYTEEEKPNDGEKDLDSWRIPCGYKYGSSGEMEFFSNM